MVIKNFFKKIKYNIQNRKGLLERPVIKIKSEETQKILKTALIQDKPCMISRLGGFELGISISADSPINFNNIIKLIKGDIATIGWNKKTSESFCNNAGFFPNDIKLFRQYSELLKKDMPFCDILASFSAKEKFYEKELQNSVKISPRELEPFDKKDPWTKYLEGKKILVVHPFEDSIREQWGKRDLLFPNKDILPEFDLQIIKAVQSAGGQKTNFENWFEALDYMKSEINKKDFDIALIGCGAYGFNLAAHVKRLGKKAVHLGGFLQILFGIMGNRWEGKYPFINEHWIRPRESDIIQNAKSIENGCYW